MSEYTAEDFKNARFAVNVDGRRAIRMAGGHWRTSSAELYPHIVLAEETGWRPVREAAEWADANPQPHTITRKQAIHVWLSGEDFADFADALRAAGIEVADDE